MIKQKGKETFSQRNKVRKTAGEIGQNLEKRGYAMQRGYSYIRGFRRTLPIL